jgi:hypothetical protein
LPWFRVEELQYFRYQNVSSCDYPGCRYVAGQVARGGSVSSTAMQLAEYHRGGVRPLVASVSRRDIKAEEHSAEFTLRSAMSTPLLVAVLPPPPKAIPGGRIRRRGQQVRETRCRHRACVAEGHQVGRAGRGQSAARAFARVGGRPTRHGTARLHCDIAGSRPIRPSRREASR